MWLVRGVLRDYDWGEIDGLARWSHSTGRPQAELWFGIHPSAPSPVVDRDGADTGKTLDAVMPAQRAPLLVKLLAAARPLSIQVHPQRELAEQLHARSALPDDEEKTEILLALEPFDINAGWRDLGAAIGVLAAAGVEGASLSQVQSHVDAVRMLWDLDTSTVTRAVAALPDAAESGGFDAAAVDALRRICTEFPDDAGALMCVLLQHKKLQPGQSIGVPAGVIHSYVRGLGVEAMTSSDNVLRLGLTSKPVSGGEALAAVRDLSPSDGSEFPFSLRVVHEESATLPSGYRVVIPLEGSVSVASPEDRMEARAGLAIVIGEDEASVVVQATGRTIVAEA